MNRVFEYIGVISIGLIVIGLVYAGLSYSDFLEYEEEVNGLIPSFLKELPNRQQYLALGEYLSCPEKESNNIEIQMNKPIKATLELTCSFANGEADVSMVLTRVNEEWELEKLRVSSDLFNSAFNQALKDRP